MAFAMTETLQTGLGALSAFSNVLQEVLGNIDGKVGDLSYSLEEIVQQLSKMSMDLASHDDRLKSIEALSDDNKSAIQAALSTFQSDFEEKLEDTSKEIHKEIVSQRALNKMDLNALRGKMTHSMSEAMNLLQDQPRLYTPAESVAPESHQHTESIDFLMDRVKKLEEAMGVQHTMNTHFSNALNSDEIVQKVYDSLYDQIHNLTSKQNDFKTENSLLKQQVRELKSVQREHERLIAELHQALVNEQRMNQLKSKIEERKAFVSGSSVTQSPKPKAEPMRRTPNTDMMNEELIYGSKVPPPPLVLAPSTGSAKNGTSTDRSTTPKSAKASPKATSVASGEGSSAGADAAPGGSSESGSSQPRVTDNTSGVVAGKRVPKSGKSKSHRPAVPSAIHEEADGVHREEAEEDAPEEPRRKRKVHRKVKRHQEDHDGDQEGSHDDRQEVAHVDADHAEKEGQGEDEEEALEYQDGEEDEEDDEYLEGEDEPIGHLSPSSSVLEGGSIFSENNSITDYYYGSDYTRKIMGGLEARHLQTQEELHGVRQHLEQRLGDLENSVTVFKRLALVIDDLRTGYEAMRAKIDAVTGQESIDEKIAQSIYAKIKNCKEMWNRVHSEMVFGLDNIPEAEKDFLRKDRDRGKDQSHLSAAQQDAHRRDAEQKLFFKLSLELVGLLDNTIEDFAPRESLAMTLKYLFPTLSRLYDQAEVLVEMDTKARESNNLDYCFDDIICSDLSTSLKGYVLDALSSSVPVLDECLHTWHLYKMLMRCQHDVGTKAERALVERADGELRGLIATKVDHVEFVAVTSRLASATEVQRLQAQVTDRLSSAGGTGTHGTSMLVQSSGTENAGPIVLRDQPEFVDLVERFSVLAHKVVDLQQLQTGCVGKEEVHEALKAVIGEVKSLRRNCVTLPVFKEGLRLKADAAELERLVKQMTAALGNINLTDFATSSAAVHAKCLICDKPVSQQRARTPGGPATVAANGVPAISGTALAMSRSLPALYDKGADKPAEKPKRSNVVTKLANAQERAKVASELNVLRSSVALPEITDSVDSPRGAAPGITPTAAAASPLPTSSASYRNRIRSSAGGGMGPGFTSDTR